MVFTILYACIQLIGIAKCIHLIGDIPVIIHSTDLSLSEAVLIGRGVGSMWFLLFMVRRACLCQLNVSHCSACSLLHRHSVK